MDQTTLEIRSNQWLNIISECQARPSGMTAKQWLEENNINSKSYYYWQRKLRKQTYNQIKYSEKLAVTCNNKIQDNEITFTEIPFPSSSNHQNCYHTNDVVHPVAVFKLANADIAISNDISSEILRLILQEVSHA